MKKILLVLTGLFHFTGVAVAQSSVTVSGTIDVSAKYVKADGRSRRLSESTDGLNSSELVFKGSEDLGDGLRAGFKLDAGTAADTGTSNTKFWNRQSYLTLSGRFGELRLGRDYTPTFLTLGIYDAFGTVGLGSTTNERQLYGGTRMDNAVQYFLPGGLGGFFGNAMVAASEGGSTADRPARYVGGRFGYVRGPFDASVAASHQRMAAPYAAGSNGVTAVVAMAPGDTLKTLNVGGSWDFGAVKLIGYVERDTANAFRENVGSLSAIVRLDVSELHLGYDRSTLKNKTAGLSTTVDQIKATYVYNLSKRTAMYATVSRLDNKDGTRLTLGGAAGPTAPGGKSQGAEFGVRHFF